MAARGEYDVSWVGEADGALFATVALEEVVGAVDILEVEGQAAPLHKLRLTWRVCDFLL